MDEPPAVVITGASRGLGLASAAHLYRQGWRVVAAMRSLESGMAALRSTAAAAKEDSRLIAVQLDLTDQASVTAAAKAIEEAVGAPRVLVHNAGISAAGTVEETPIDLWERMFATAVFGPVLLTKALLPSMRAAGRGRIVMISSQGGVRGMPEIAAYSAAKGALERWAESLAAEVAPFGLGVTVLVAGPSTLTSSPTREPRITATWPVRTPRCTPRSTGAAGPRCDWRAHRSSSRERWPGPSRTARPSLGAPSDPTPGC